MIKKIHIGSEDRPICFNFNCLEEFEEMTGTDPLNGLQVNIKTAKALIYCGLKYGIDPEGRSTDPPPFDVKTVGSWLDGHALNAAMDAFNSQDHSPETEKKKVMQKNQKKRRS
jgi:hypothetical protein